MQYEAGQHIYFRNPASPPRKDIYTGEVKRNVSVGTIVRRNDDGTYMIRFPNSLPFDDDRGVDNVEESAILGEIGDNY